jgi:hypothetical protein
VTGWPGLNGVTLATAVPWWVIVLAGVALVALAVRTYAGLPLTRSRRALLVALRIATLLTLGLFLLRPVAVQPAPRAGAVVPVLIDASRSMGIRDAPVGGEGHEGDTRFARAVALAAGPLARALEGFGVELLELRTEIGPLDAAREPDAGASPLAEALADLRARYQGRAVPGIVLLSDGGETGADVAWTAEEGPAVFTVPIGSEAPPADLEVVGVELDAHALPGSSVELTATVVSHGFGRDPIDVRLLAAGRPLEVRRVVPAADGLPVRVTFTLPPAGDRPAVYTVNIPSRRGEATEANNARHAVVQPIGRPRRLLFVQGGPGYEHSFLARAWRDDPRLDLDTVVRKGQNDRGEATFYIQAEAARAESLTAMLPADRAQLFAYDALVFANVPQDLLSDAHAGLVEAFVSRRGGGLLVLGARSFGRRGLAATPLGLLLPVAPRQAFAEAARASWSAPAAGRGGMANVLRPTSDGDRHPLLRVAASPSDAARRWREAPALAGVAAAGDPRPGAQVLAVASSAGVTRPVLAVQRYGEGRTMVFAGEATWRWKMQRPLEDRLFETFWRQVARWLAAPAPEPIAIDVGADPQPGRPAALTVLVRDEAFEPVRDAAVEIVVRDDRGGEEILRPALQDAAGGRYAVEWRPSHQGLFRLSASARRASARLASADHAVYVGAADVETADPRRQDDVLRRMAERTGGQVVSPEEIGRIAGALQARAAAAPMMTARELWHGPWTLMAIIALLGIEWSLRRRWGLR